MKWGMAMTKNDLCRQIFEDLLNRELLNEADAFDIASLQQEVERLINGHLQDYAIVCKAGIMSE